jgi:hypothetical protein
MRCEELLKMLNDYVDGDIEVGICKEFEKHLAGCNPCQIVVDTIKKTITLYREADVYPVPGDFTQKLHDALRNKWSETRGDSRP